MVPLHSGQCHEGAALSTVRQLDSGWELKDEGSGQEWQGDEGWQKGEGVEKRKVPGRVRSG